MLKNTLVAGKFCSKFSLSELWTTSYEHQIKVGILKTPIIKKRLSKRPMATQQTGRGKNARMETIQSVSGANGLEPWTKSFRAFFPPISSDLFTGNIILIFIYQLNYYKIIIFFLLQICKLIRFKRPVGVMTIGSFKFGSFVLNVKKNKKKLEKNNLDTLFRRIKVGTIRFLFFRSKYRFIIFLSQQNQYLFFSNFKVCGSVVLIRQLRSGDEF